MAASPLRPEDANASVATVTLLPGDMATRNSVVDAASRLPTATPTARGSNIGRYLMIEEIGRGGMGVVWRAYDPRLHREVALKSMRADRLSAEARARTLREAQAMARLSHPNVVAVYDVELSGDDVVIAMEYVRGTTLRAWLAHPRSWRDTLALFVAAGRGLAAAHAAGILHRDFKPANVLVGDDGRARVTDFGLARVREFAPEVSMRMPETSDTRPAGSNESHLVDTTQADIVLGTPRYMAPEQHDGSAIDPAADQFAFCVALWEGLTGQPPFLRTDFHDAARDKRQGPPPWPRDVAVPHAVRFAVCRGLAGDPAARWPTVQLLLDALVEGSRPHHRRWIIAASTVAVLGVSGAAWAGYRDQLAERCTGAAHQLAKVWDDERRELVRQALLATGVAYADRVGERVASQLDAYATGWMNMHTQACEATTLRGEQPVRVMDLRMACLRRAKIDLQAVTDLLSRADAQVVEKAHQVVGSLPGVERCANVEALQAAVPPPAPEHRDAVEEVRVELAEIRALREAGKYAEALARVQPLSARTEAIAFAPLETEVTEELASNWEGTGSLVAAEVSFRRALRLALSNKQWENASIVATRLVSNVGLQQTRTAEGLAYSETAEALLALAGETAAAHAEREAALRGAIGGVLRTQGRFPEAEAEDRAAVALAEEVWGPHHLNVAAYRAGLGRSLSSQGRLQEAELELRALLAAQERVLGSEHPDVAATRSDVGNTLHTQGRFAEAEAEHREALRVWQQTLGPDHFHTAIAHSNLANALASQDRLEEAEADYKAAIRGQRKSLGQHHAYITFTQGGLAKALIVLGRYAEAEAHLREAVASAEQTYGTKHHHVARLRSTLAVALVRQERHLEAEAEARDSVHGVRDQDDPHVSHAHGSLAMALDGQGRHAEAEIEFRKALEIVRRLLGPEHPIGAAFLTSLGTNLEAQGRYEEAEMQLRAALKLQVKALGKYHSRNVTTQGRLGSVLRARGRHDEAQVLYGEALASLERLKRRDQPVRTELEAGLARTLLEAGSPDQALSLFERAWAAGRDDVRLAGPVRAQIAFGLAQALWQSDTDRARARALARDALALFGPHGSHHHQRAEISAWLSERNARR